MTSLSIDLSIKQLQVLREAVPRASRLALQWNPDSVWHPHVVQALREDERALGVPLQMLPIRAPGEFDAAFRAMVRDRAGAALVLADPMTVTHRRRLADHRAADEVRARAQPPDGQGARPRAAAAAAGAGR